MRTTFHMDKFVLKSNAISRTRFLSMASSQSSEVVTGFSTVLSQATVSTLEARLGRWQNPVWAVERQWAIDEGRWGTDFRIRNLPRGGQRQMTFGPRHCASYRSRASCIRHLTHMSTPAATRSRYCERPTLPRCLCMKPDLMRESGCADEA